MERPGRFSCDFLGEGGRYLFSDMRETWKFTGSKVLKKGMCLFRHGRLCGLGEYSNTYIYI